MLLKAACVVDSGLMTLSDKSRLPFTSLAICCSIRVFGQQQKNLYILFLFQAVYAGDTLIPHGGIPGHIQIDRHGCRLQV